jgi:mannobiose 2-epimerase
MQSNPVVNGTAVAIRQFQHELKDELHRILEYWIRNTPDNQFGGFTGRIDQENKIVPRSPKGVVLNSRILWTFSAAFNVSKQYEYMAIAERAFDYLQRHFFDRQQGGVYWSVDYKGMPLDTKKQLYAQAFAIYGLSEYAKAADSDSACNAAIALYELITRHGYDPTNGGYVEALSADWKATDDLRLSEKDANEKKSMNTHLHLLEAFSNLYTIWPDATLKKRIIELIRIFLDRMTDVNSHHLLLFFDDQWNSKSSLVSFGHDIEGAWLVQQAAETIKDEPLTEEIKVWSVTLANAAAMGVDEDGGLWYEKEGELWIKEKHWWPQSEAMVGFFHAWELTGQDRFLQYSLQCWEFVKNFIHDKKYGEWFWGIRDDHAVMEGEDKVGIWKCPYHNGRACMEIMKRVDHLL